MMKRRILTALVAVLAVTVGSASAAVMLEGRVANPELNGGNDFTSFTDSYTLAAASDSVFVAAVYHFDNDSGAVSSAEFGGTAMEKIAFTDATNPDLKVAIFAVDLGDTVGGSQDIVISMSEAAKGSAAYYQLSNTSLTDDVSDAWASTADSGFTLSGMAEGGLVIDMQADGSRDVGAAIGSPTDTFVLGNTANSGAPGGRGLKSSNYNDVAAGDVTVGYASNAAAGTVAVGFQPIPEPATMSLLALGGLGVLIRRKK